MTRARVRALHDKVNSLLNMCDFDNPLDGLLLHSNVLCIIRYEPQEQHLSAQAIGVEVRSSEAGEGAEPVGASTGQTAPRPTMSVQYPVPTGADTGWPVHEPVPYRFHNRSGLLNGIGGRSVRDPVTTEPTGPGTGTLAPTPTAPVQESVRPT